MFQWLFPSKITRWVSNLGALPAEPFVQQAMDNLVALGPTAVEPVMRAWTRKGWYPDSAMVVLARIGAPALSPVIEAARSPHPKIRLAAAQILGNMRLESAGDDRRRISALSGLLGDNEQSVRSAAIKGLVSLEACDALITALEHEDYDIRVAAASASCWSIKDQRAVPILVEHVLQREHGNLRSAAAQALGRIEAAAGVTALIDLVTEDSCYKWVVVPALGRIKDDRAAYTMLKLAREDMQVARQAVDGLTSIIEAHAHAIPDDLLVELASLKSVSEVRYRDGNDRDEPDTEHICECDCSALRRFAGLELTRRNSQRSQ
jgi:HEAT repeat protein